MTYLSVIIPAYNEERRLPETIHEVSLYLGNQDYKSEILVVENGSTDRTTKVAWSNINYATNPLPNVRGRVIHSFKGKGVAVKSGMLLGQGTWLYMCDVDLSTPIEFLKRFLPPNFEGDVGIGSRSVRGSARYDEPITRKITGRVFNRLTNVLVPGVKDTQCGFKIFKRRAAHDIFNRVTIPGFAFDVEVLYLAKKLGYGVQEIGVPWYHNGDSKVSVLSDSLQMVRDIFKIWLRWQGGEYELEEDLVHV